MIAFMTRLALISLLPCVLLADEPKFDFSDALRKGLFAEESTRDLKSATQHYQSILDAYGRQRQYAGTALYRLAEIKRMQGDKETAAKLYQRVLTEFADDETLAKLSRENLSALGVPMAVTQSNAPPAEDSETREIARLRTLLASGPT